MENGGLPRARAKAEAEGGNQQPKASELRDADGGRGRLPHRTDEISHRIVAPNFYEAVPTRPTSRLRKRGSRRWPVVFGRRGAPTKLPYVSAFVVR